jgi:starvation-inducible outer membrane lipoprotein
MPGALLDPSQGTEDRNVGKRIRWAGAVQYIDASGKGDCLTILYARSGDHGEPRWTSEPTYQTFRACAAGSYDPQLDATFSNVTIVGRISGKANIGMGGGGSTGPVVEIEKLFRWSDCVAGDTNAICKYGFLSPTPASR